MWKRRQGEPGEQQPEYRQADASGKDDFERARDGLGHRVRLPSISGLDIAHILAESALERQYRADSL